LEGEARELIRRIQELRKSAGFNVDDRIEVCYSGESKLFDTFGELIAREILATGITQGEIPEAEIEELIELENEPFKIWIKRIVSDDML
jgi:isoleucyl-tRNA synthetase